MGTMGSVTVLAAPYPATPIPCYCPTGLDLHSHIVNPLVSPISGYEDRAAIVNFVAASIERYPRIAAMLRNAGTDKLVAVKPNWIQESREDRPDVWVPVITHPEVVLAVVETLAAFMNGRGTICICDAPHTYADFAAIVARGGLTQKLDRLRQRWPALRIELLDLRREVWRRKQEVVVERLPNAEDPRGYVRLDLARSSLFHGFSGEGAYFGADYDIDVVNRHHQGDVQEYLLAGTPMACDLFVNLPKLKTHKKTGITCALKNLVGINGDKNWLPHHVLGTPADGGDEFPRRSLANIVEGRFKRFGQRTALALPRLGTWAYRKARNVGKRTLGDSATTIRNGNWIGNDTCWRMALDLNRCLLFGNPNGTWREAGAAKHYLAIADGIVGGERNGPLCPDAVPSSVLASCANPAVLDAVAARLMGFAPASLPIVARAFDRHRWPIADRDLEQIAVDDERAGGVVPLHHLAPAIARGFVPHFGWTALVHRT